LAHETELTEGAAMLYFAAVVVGALVVMDLLELRSGKNRRARATREN